MQTRKICMIRVLLVSISAPNWLACVYEQTTQTFKNAAFVRCMLPIAAGQCSRCADVDVACGLLTVVNWFLAGIGGSLAAQLRWNLEGDAAAVWHRSPAARS